MSERLDQTKNTRPTKRPGLPFEDGFEILEGAWVSGLAQPEDGLLADGGVGVVVGDMHELRDAIILGKLAQSEHRPLFDLHVRVVFYGGGDGRAGFLAGFLGQPEDGLTANLRVGIGMGHLEQLVDSSGVGVDREVESQFFAQLWVLLFSEQLLKDLEALVTALSSKPEGGLFTEVRRV